LTLGCLIEAPAAPAGDLTLPDQAAQGLPRAVESFPKEVAALPAKPNILFIVGDDMGCADVGFHGCKDIPTPMQATDDRLAKFPNVTDRKRRTYDAMMLAMDEAIGRVRRKLADTGLEQSTFVYFISDNGGPTMPGTTINAT
jgi:arylsulfatase A-like enzyme